MVGQECVLTENSHAEIFYKIITNLSAGALIKAER